MATADEIAQLIERTVKSVLSGIQGNPFSGNKGNRRVLDATGVARVDSFGGKEAQW